MFKLSLVFQVRMRGTVKASKDNDKRQADPTGSKTTDQQSKTPPDIIEMTVGDHTKRLMDLLALKSSNA